MRDLAPPALRSRWSLQLMLTLLSLAATIRVPIQATRDLHGHAERSLRGEPSPKPSAESRSRAKADVLSSTQINKKICLSISSFHPETWQPSWGIRTALLALMAFFTTEVSRPS